MGRCLTLKASWRDDEYLRKSFASSYIWVPAQGRQQFSSGAKLHLSYYLPQARVAYAVCRGCTARGRTGETTWYRGGEHGEDCTSSPYQMPDPATFLPSTHPLPNCLPSVLAGFWTQPTQVQSFYHYSSLTGMGWSQGCHHCWLPWSQRREGKWLLGDSCGRGASREFVRQTRKAGNRRAGTGMGDWTWRQKE